jgi:hypothetical protein
MMRIRRRKVLIRPRLQLKLVLVFTGVSILTLLLQYILFITLATRFAERMPSGGEYLTDALPGMSIQALLSSLAVLLPTSLAVGVACTFRIAGPVHKLEGYLRGLARGEAHGPCRLRKGDELGELCDAINAVAERMRESGALMDDADADARDDGLGAAAAVDGPPVLRHPGRRSRAGISMIEALIVMMVLSIAMGMFATTMSSMASQRRINRETSVATEAARVTLERMRERPFAEVSAHTTPNPADDPGGAGSAPGPTFEVAPLAGATGRVVLPMLLPVADAEELLEDLLGAVGGLLGGGGASPPPPAPDPDIPQLREDYEDVRLGMPRDLNGDGVIDQVEHCHDYVILPVLVQVEWSGSFGAREVRLYTQLTAMD